MARHTIERDARGRVADISGTCGSDACPVEDADDDGGLEYRCPVTGDVLAVVDAVDTPDTPEDRRPATVDDVRSDRRRE